MIKFNPITLDAEMPRGDTGDFSIRPKNKNTGEYILQEGSTVYFTLRNAKTRAKVLQKVVTSFDEGIAVIPLVPDDTKNLDVGNYIFGIDIVRNDGTNDNVTPNWEARFTLKRGVKE